jgi:hypothetical protein
MQPINLPEFGEDGHQHSWLKQWDKYYCVGCPMEFPLIETQPTAELLTVEGATTQPEKRKRGAKK